MKRITDLRPLFYAARKFLQYRTQDYWRRCHAEEMKKAIPKEPILFLKPTTSYIREPSPIRLPANHIVHHEIELGVIIKKNGRNIPQSRALDFVAGYCLALDLTCRDLQDKAKAEGLPWTTSKGFDTFCPVGDYIHADAMDPHDQSLTLEVNGQVRQKGHTSSMIFKIPELIEYISSRMRLEAGDLILTGTPKGVGPINIGDVLIATMGHDYSKMKFRAMPAPTLLHLKKL